MVKSISLGISFNQRCVFINIYEFGVVAHKNDIEKHIHNMIIKCSHFLKQFFFSNKLIKFLSIHQDIVVSFNTLLSKNRKIYLLAVK